MPAQEAQPQKSAVHDISDWTKLRKVGVPACDVGAIAVLKADGISVREREGVLSNPHALSAAYREAGFMAVLQREGRGKIAMTIWDKFGSARTKSYLPNSSPPYVPVDFEGRIFSSKKFDITLFSGPDLAIAGDASRGVFVRHSVPDDQVDMVISTDVYHFSIDDAKEMCSLSKTGNAYVLLRMFPGMAGADAPYVGNDGEKVIEQIYYRDVDGLVVSSSDRSTGCYAPHPDPDWLNQRSICGVDISPVQKFGPYQLYRLALTKEGCIPINVIPDVVGECQMLELPTVRYLLGWRFLAYETKESVVVHLPTLTSVGPKLFRKIPSGQVFDMAQGFVTTSFVKTLWLVELERRFPEFHRKLVLDTVHAVVYYGRKEEVRKMYALRQAHSESERELVVARHAENRLASTVDYTYYGIGIFAAICTAGAAFRYARPGAWILPRHPLLSAVLEEGLAFVSEPLACAGICYEMITASNEGRPLLRALLHSACLVLRNWVPAGRLVSLVLHLGWNWRTRSIGGRLTEFLEVFKEGRLLDSVRSCVMPIPAGMTFPSYTAEMIDGPKNFRGSIDVYVNGCEMTVPEAFLALGRPPGRNVTYPVLITQRLLQQPSNTATNLLAAALHRIHNDPFVDNPFSDDVRHGRWRELGLIVIGYLPDTRSICVSVDENIQAMGKKGKRLRDALDDDTRGILLHPGKTVNLKWNETITAQKDVNGILTMKPRAIQNLPPLTHALMGGFARSFAKVLHDVFDGSVTMIAGHPVRIFFASGYDQGKLSEIGQAIEDGHTVFAMSGDDSVVAWGGILSEFAGEADQSQFDHTQDDGPMKHYIGPILAHLGLPDDFIQMAYKACSEGYTLRKKELFARGFAGTQMPTGVTTTTTMNSMSTFAMFVWFMHNRDRLTGLAEAGQELGFIVKFFPRESVHQLTFLKGWFLRGEGGLSWYPLPSACLKIGKLLNDPVAITVVTNRGRKVRFSVEDAIAQCATALASSYGTVDRSYPILGEFLYTLRRLGKQPRKHLAQLQESWKPQMDGISVDRQGAIEAIGLRYGIDLEEIESVESLLQSVTSLPSYIEHVVFDKLCDVDY